MTRNLYGLNDAFKAIKEIQDVLITFTSKNIDLNGRQIKNAGHSIDAHDYVIREEIVGDGKTPSALQTTFLSIVNDPLRAPLLLINPTLDQTTLTLRDALGTTTGNSFEIQDGLGNVVFKVIGSTDSGAPSALVTKSHYPFFDDTYDIGAISVRWHKLWCTDIDAAGDIAPTNDLVGSLGDVSHSWLKLWSGSLVANAGKSFFGGNLNNSPVVEIQNTHVAGFSSVNFLTSGGIVAGTVGFANASAGVGPDTFLVGTGAAKKVSFYVNGIIPFQLNTSGHLIPTVTNTYDIGGNITKFLNIWSEFYWVGATGGIQGTSGIVPILHRVTIANTSLSGTGLQITDASGTTSGDTLSLKTFGGTAFLRVIGGTDAGAPGTLLTRDHISLVNVTYRLGASSNRWKELWIQDIDFSGNITGCEVLDAAASGNLTLSNAYADLPGCTVTLDKEGTYLITTTVLITLDISDAAAFAQLVINGVVQSGSITTTFPGSMSYTKTWSYTNTGSQVAKIQVKTGVAGAGVSTAFQTESNITASYFGAA